jgi:hypothetical protein
MAAMGLRSGTLSVADCWTERALMSANAERHDDVWVIRADVKMGDRTTPEFQGPGSAAEWRKMGRHRRRRAPTS